MSMSMSPATATLERTVGAARAAPAPFLIDSHAHVSHRGLALASDRRYAPDHDAPLDLFLRRLDEHGMSHGVLVQPSYLGNDNSYLEACLKAAGGRLRGIAMLDPETSPGELARLDRAGFVGVRLNLLGKPMPDFESTVWQRFANELAWLGWQIEIQRPAADLAPVMASLLGSGTNVVFDHFLLPDPKLGIDDPGFRKLLKFASAKRLWAKISAPYRNGPDGEAFARRAYPLLRAAFGPDRLLWGSDWPHLQHEGSETYGRGLAFFESLEPDPAIRARILANPKDLYRF